MNYQVQVVPPVEWAVHLATLCREIFPPDARVHNRVAELTDNLRRLESLGIFCNTEDFPVPGTTGGGTRMHPEVWRCMNILSRVADAAFIDANESLARTLRYMCTNLKYIRAEFRSLELERAA